MTTTAEKLQIIIDNKAAIKQAIIEKGGEVGDFTTYASAIANLPSGGDTNPTAEKNDVTFYDFDGTIRYSYTAEEFLALNELPSLPTQSGLTCQGWNYDFINAKTYVEEYGKLDIGATYITDDGKTRLYIKIADEGRMTVPLYFSQTVANGVTIDWGDGSAVETLDGTGNLNTTHTYANIGDYCITLTVASGCTLGLGHGSFEYCVMGNIDNNVYSNMLQKVEIGTGVTSIEDFAFSICYSLASVTIPSSVTSIADNVFYSCYSLASVTIPDSVTSIVDNTFYSCSSLASVTIPSSVTTIGSGAFDTCYSLASVTIPDSVTSIEYGVFNDCYSLSSVTIPDSVTSIADSTFYSCYSLASVTIPSSVTTIEGYVFQYCSSLASVTIPSSVTSIGRNTFYNCSGMAYYDFSTHTAVPTLANTNAFTGIPSDCKIVVPDNLYDTWIAATNWSTYASYIIKKTDWDALQN